MPIHEQLDPAQIVFAIFAVALGSFVQGAAGFGFGLITVPLLIWAGLDLPMAVAVLGATVLVQTAAGSWKFRKHIVWRDLPGMMVGRMIGVPIGLAIMAWLTAGGVELMKQGVGVVLLGVLALIVLLRPKPRHTVSNKWVPAVSLSSGVLSGTTGMGGPPLVLWMVAHDWSTKRSRVFLWALFLQLMPVQLGLMLWKFGGELWWGIAGGLVMTPVVVFAGHTGAKVGSRWSRQTLRRVTLGLLVVLALASIASPWLG
ncbi:MAG: sulfite exporter TauE/SafE family protein [Planctomycetota bacterium]